MICKFLYVSIAISKELFFEQPYLMMSDNFEPQKTK